MSGSTPNGNYRDELVAIIKDIGQELIDRAEEMVAEDATFIKDFHIDIDIPNPRDEDPTITWQHSTLCTNYLNRIDPGLELKSRSVREKTAYWYPDFDCISGDYYISCSGCEYVIRRGVFINDQDLPEVCPSCKAIMKNSKCDT